MKFKQPICHKYERLINNELAAALQFHDQALEDGLKTRWHFTEEGRKHAGLGPNDTLYDFIYQSIDVLPRMRFIYLMSLFEAFLKDYICIRSAVDKSAEILNQYKSYWNKNLSATHGSNSLLNPRYVNYVFKEEYGLELLTGINDITLEIGDLRNIIAHHEGRIPDKDNNYFLGQLERTLNYLELPHQIGVKVTITNEMMWIYINDMRKIIGRCDY
ncbi:hypothetical protein ACKE5C_19180 (plasmid) [Aneurinibacillus thermoaerophilus]|uniref:MAE-28990/MAE-18760-like HEPN domain-containing protein n=1 Tax=Aneurinibacillus thermoaerophilus TaxID=143495 RepID=A0ABX8YHW2_ANETH|nr:hypothetical protein [Aneurinibacillus thermoaerophilus]QYY44769.1 hypothetical protein K3F53_19195 [Aneurinibacillus thermoaerophilus]